MKLNDYQLFIHGSRYARWLEEEGRRETLEETAKRLSDYWLNKGLIDVGTADDIEQAFLSMGVMPSMRSLMTAGPALDRDHVAGYNCAYLPIDDVRAFDETMYVLLCGTGVGYSVERKAVNKLPTVAEDMHLTDTVIKVADSKIGWAKSLRELISLLYAGQIPQWDVSKVRPSGARLKTFGGRASGPDPLVELFEFVIRVFRDAAGRQLTPLECHDIVCKIAEIVVVGGVRRSALISLSDPGDRMMARCKSGFKVDEYVLVNETDEAWEYALTMKKGQPCHPTYKVTFDKEGGAFDKQALEFDKVVQWYKIEPQRALANNSAVYEEKPSYLQYRKEMTDLYESYSGERGFFSREAAKNIVERNGRRDSNYDFGCNPCSEILLRPNEFCNLSEAVVRPDDSLKTLLRKVEFATILGTLQATLTDFRYLRKVWQKNCEEERLLGVSLTGAMDHPVLNGSEAVGDTAKSKKMDQWLNKLREKAVETNKLWAEKLGIPQAAAVTCVKPSGTVSQLALCASGIHPAHSKYYIRAVRQDNKDPMTDFLKAQGVPNEPCFMKPDTTTVFSFPIESPDTSVFRDDVGALGQLEVWKAYQEFWCEHKPSVTVYYTDDEFDDVCSWVWKNWDVMSGISLLPYNGGTYKQAPYQECDKETYDAAVKAMPKVDWSEIVNFERGDTTTGSQELACTGGACEIVGSAS